MHSSILLSVICVVNSIVFNAFFHSSLGHIVVDSIVFNNNNNSILYSSLRAIKAVVRHILMHSPILLRVICVVDSIVFNQLAVHPRLPT